MIGYQNWKESEYLVTSLSLDPLNPRLPEIDKKLSQKELIEELIKHEDVYEIAKSISEDGYYPVERLICVKEGNKKYVVEGNRRLAALKLLISPESAPEREQKKYRTLSNSISSLEQIKKVKVTIAPDRKSANHYIRNKHTSPTIRPWKPIQQAKFYKNMIISGSTIADISKDYMVPVGEITENLQLLDMYNIACNIKLPDDTKEFVLDSRRFPVSTLQRAFQNQEIKKFLGIDFDSNKKLLGKINKEEFTKGYAKLVIDIVNGELDSRIINTDKDVKNYLSKIKDYRPDLSQKGKFHINDLVAGEIKPRIISDSEKDKAKKKAKRSTSLIASDFRCTVENERIKSIFKELRKLKVEDYINSVAILLRVLLELSLAHYLDETGKISEVRKDLQKKNPKKQYHVDYYPTLAELLDYILYVDNNIGDLNTQARKALMKLVSARGTIYDKDFLDSFVHNKFVMPSEPQLRTFWEQLMPIFAVTLKEPSN